MDLLLPDKDFRTAQELQESVIFLVTRMLESGHNPKPVIFHSVRVGMALYNFDYDTTVVKAGFLHDIIEDSDTQITEIAHKFGSRVAQLVQANTFDYSIETRAAQGKDCIERCLNYGRDALVIRVADKLENSSYFDPATLDKDFAKFWVGEMRYLVDISQPDLGSEPLWEEFNQQCKKLEIGLRQIASVNH